MGDSNYDELIYQELMEIQEDTNSINGQQGEYFNTLIYHTSGDKYMDIIVVQNNQIIVGLGLIMLLLFVNIFYNFYHRIFNHRR